MKHTKRRDFRAHVLVGWWLFWLTISQTTLNIAVPPSSTALLHFGLLLISFIVGFALTTLFHRSSPLIEESAVVTLAVTSIRVRWTVYGLSVFALLLLLASLNFAGAFTTSFLEYFAKLRVDAEDGSALTGIKVLDTLTKVYAFPVSYGLILVILGAGVRPFRLALTICLLNFGLFSYLWQVNYPIIHLFWLAFFYLTSRYINGVSINRWSVVGLAFSCALLVLSAMNRFGGDAEQLVGAIRRYVMGYHLIGFSFYDFQLAEPTSLIHIYSYGRSSLGFLDLLLEHAARAMGGNYIAASSENSTYNDTAVVIGVDQSESFNAFGTLAFTFYRDFGLAGIATGGLFYGGMLAYGLLNLQRNWVAASTFYFLASTWMMGMMVSPVEQTYFWFGLVFLAVVRASGSRTNYSPSCLRSDSTPSARRKPTVVKSKTRPQDIGDYQAHRRDEKGRRQL